MHKFGCYLRYILTEVTNPHSVANFSKCRLNHLSVGSIWGTKVHNSLFITGGDLVHVLGVRGRRVSAENIFLPSPKMRNLGGTVGTNCLLETNVGSVLSCIDSGYITIFYPLTPDLCLFLVGSGSISKSTTYI